VLKNKISVKKNIKVLCIDIEGGHGGSSRSLFQFLEAMDRTNIEVKVICRLESWLRDSYKKLGIGYDVESNIPRFTVLQKINRNLLQLIFFHLFIWPKSHVFRKKLLNMSKDYDVVHCNHISLMILAQWLKKYNPKLLFTMHIRTLPYSNYFSRVQALRAKEVFDGFVFITENEFNHMGKLLHNNNIPGKVIFNPIKTNTLKLQKHSQIPMDNRLKIGVLSHFSYMRGIDRVVNIMESVPPKNKKDILFIIAGDMKLNEKLPGLLGKIAKKGGSLEDYVHAKGLKEYFLFLGEIKDPEKFVSSIDILIKPTRENNPWGRDILESMSYGKTIASVGSYNKFVETGSTGLLQKNFDAEELALWLTQFIKNRTELHKMGENAKSRISTMCNPKEKAEELKNFWLEIYKT